MSLPSGSALARPQAFLIPEHVMVAKLDFLVLFHAGFSLSEMQKSMGKSFKLMDIKNVILSASEADHAAARLKAPNMVSLAKDRFKAAALGVAERILEINLTAEKDSDGVRAGEVALKAAGILGRGAQEEKKKAVLPVTQEDVERMQRHYRESMGIIDAEEEPSP